MNVRPTDRQWFALSTVALLEDGKVVLGLLKEMLEVEKDQLITLMAEPQILRAQGRAAALKELVEALEQAPDLVSKLKRRT